MKQYYSPGIYHDVPIEDYHGNPWGLTRTAASKLLVSEQKFEDYRNQRGKPVQRSRSIVLGSMLHSMFEDEVAFLSSIAVWYGGNRTGKEWKAFKAQNEGKRILTDDDFNRVSGMYQSLKNHPEANERLFVREGAKEVTALWIDEETGVRCQCRPDKINTDHREIVELKSARTAAPQAIATELAKISYSKDCFTFGGPLQVAWLLEGMNSSADEYDKFTFVVVENSAPYHTVVYQPDMLFREYGDNQRKQAIRRYARYIERDSRPASGYSDTVETLSLPPWIENILTAEIWR